MRQSTAALLLLVLQVVPRSAAAYSVLTHEAMIDAAWADHLEPLLKRRFPRSSAIELRTARAYAFGGSLIQDLGCYPFGSKFFSNLVQYVRSGDFVEALVREARDVNEYAFALGALAHYTSDSVGHPIAVNRAVAIMYPKLHAKHGPEVLYAELAVTPRDGGIRVRRATGVARQVHVRRYQSLIGFEIALRVLERAFRAVTGR